MAFYMHSKLPIVVVEDWGQKNITTEDSWRKELLEAGRFAPASSKNILLPNSSMPALLCKNPVTWVLTTPSVAITHTYLKTAQVIGKNENYFLLRFSRSEMQCAENF